MAYVGKAQKMRQYLAQTQAGLIALEKATGKFENMDVVKLMSLEKIADPFREFWKLLTESLSASPAPQKAKAKVHWRTKKKLAEAAAAKAALATPTATAAPAKKKAQARKSTETKVATEVAAPESPIDASSEGLEAEEEGVAAGLNGGAASAPNPFS